MSHDAVILLERIRAQFTSTEAPSLPGRYFHAGANDAAYEELATLGIVYKVLGTERGFAWRLTDEGQRQLFDSGVPSAPNE